jgi:hypothetical protein
LLEWESGKFFTKGLDRVLSDLPGGLFPPRHCERSEAIQLSYCRQMDCFAALAMTVAGTNRSQISKCSAGVGKPSAARVTFQHRHPRAARDARAAAAAIWRDTLRSKENPY